MQPNRMARLNEPQEALKMGLEAGLQSGLSGTAARMGRRRRQKVWRTPVAQEHVIVAAPGGDLALRAAAIFYGVVASSSPAGARSSRYASSHAPPPSPLSLPAPGPVLTSKPCYSPWLRSPRPLSSPSPSSSSCFRTRGVAFIFFFF